MNGVFIFVLISYIVLIECKLYDRYSGDKTDETKRECSVKVKPCTSHEGSRIDGTCNNFKRPSRGSAMGPYLRLLKPDYGNLGSIRKDKDHEPLPSARKVRTMIWSDGRVTDTETFTRAAAHYLQFVHNDITFTSSVEDILKNKTNCCKEQSKKNNKCKPIYVPSDDPYLRHSDIKCMNYSRVDTFQDFGCLTKEMDPEQINYQTPLLDLSTIYGVDDEALKGIRRFDKGLLKEELRKGRHVPLNETRDICRQNNGSSKVCYKFGYPEAGNYDLTTTTLGIFFYREHNRIARALHELNPCWKDDRLFKVARRINIATAANIFLYELLPVIMGHKNMIHFHLMSEEAQFVHSYDEDTDPLVFAEYEVARQYFYTLWDGRIKKYDEKYWYAGEFSLSDTLFRQELIEENTNFEEINRGTFYQKAGRMDDIVDPGISENFFAKFFKAHDQIAIGIQRGRDMGLHGYNSYRKFCGDRYAKKFEDLLDAITPERVEILKRLYKDVDDIDLLVGIMSEEFIRGTYVGPTLFCIMSKQLQVYRFSDRFWFERGQQVHSFTLPQLQEIRKTNMARIACDNAEGIKFIQPHALFNIAHGNEHVPCSHVPKADLTKWKDPSCDKYYKVEQLDDHHKEELYKYLTREQTIQEIPGAVVYTKVPEIYRSYSQVLNPGYVSINRFTKTYTTQ